jgi:hypothetical protein
MPRSSNGFAPALAPEPVALRDTDVQAARAAEVEPDL